MTTTNSINSPKNKFRGTIYQAGISGSGDTLSLSWNDFETLKGWLEKKLKVKLLNYHQRKQKRIS